MIISIKTLGKSYALYLSSCLEIVLSGEEKQSLADLLTWEPDAFSEATL